MFCTCIINYHPENNRSLVNQAASLDLYLSCHSSMITVVKQTYQESMISIIKWPVHGICTWLSTLNSGCQQVAVACSATTCKCKEVLHQILNLVAIKWEIQVEASIKAKGQLYCYLSITHCIFLYIVSPTHLTPPVVKRALDSMRLCFTD